MHAFKHLSVVFAATQSWCAHSEPFNSSWPARPKSASGAAALEIGAWTAEDVGCTCAVSDCCVVFLAHKFRSLSCKDLLGITSRFMSRFHVNEVFQQDCKIFSGNSVVKMCNVRLHINAGHLGVYETYAPGVLHITTDHSLVMIGNKV